MSEALLVLLFGGSALGLAGVLTTLASFRTRRGKKEVPEAVSPAPQEAFVPRECPPLLFPAHSATLSSDGARVLGAWAAELAGQPGFRLLVVGSADTAGNPSRNRALARERAQAAARVLNAAGIPADRLDVSWREPEPGRTARDQAALRCVRISVLS